MTSINGHFQLQRDNFSLAAEFNFYNQGITVLFGQSGAGKTTLLRCIAGLEHAQGFLQVNGHCWQDTSRHLFLPPHQRPVGYVFQEASLFSHLSVQHNLEYGWQRTPTHQRKITLTDAIEWLGIAPLLKRNPIHLSGGERQRVAIARALLTSPELLLMDEPLAALDIDSKAEILPCLERLHTTLSIPILYITHALPEIMRLADNLAIIAQGKIIASSTMTDVLTRFDLPLTQADDAGVVIEATVIEHDESFHLTYLGFCGGCLSLLRNNLPLGTRVRVGLKARDVSLALENEVNSSILNIFPAKILEIAACSQGQLLVKLDVQGAIVLARISQKSGFLLNLQVNMSIYARVKSVALL